MYKVIFFDVDGTLYSHVTHKVPESTIKSLNALREKGIKLIICTGRHISTLNRLDLGALQFDGFITSNGQICYDAEQNFLNGNSFDPVSLDFIITLFNKKEIPITLISENQVYLNFVNESADSLYSKFGITLPPVKEYKGEPIYQASAEISIEDEDEFIAIMPSTCKLARWAECGTDIVTTDGGKGFGIKYFLKHLGFTKEDAMAFGDAQNDIEMFEEVGTSIAMGNGMEALKAKATYITSDIDDDGIEKALKYFNLL